MAVVANLVVRVTAAMSDFEKDIKGLQGKWNRIGGQLQTVGGNLTRGLTVPMAALGGLALKFSADFETAMTKVQTLSGNSAEQVAEMRKSVLSLAGTVGQGPVALADALLVIT